MEITSGELTRTAYDVQQDFGRSSTVRSKIIWDSFLPDQDYLLKLKIKTLTNPSNDNNNSFQELQNNIFNNVWLQRQYSNGTLFSSIIYILVADVNDVNAAKNSTKFTCHPVIRTRKCCNKDSEINACMIFIDEHGRVYNDWNQYLVNNKLPKGIMIAPTKGIYTLNVNNVVELSYCCTPKSDTLAQAQNITDIVATSSGFVAAVPLFASFIFPIAAPVILAATAVSTAVATYSTARSVGNLIDRNVHGQSVNVTNREARANWLSMGGGILGFGSLGFTNIAQNAANSGNTISTGTRFVVNSINASSILVSGGTVVNGIYDLYMKINYNEQIEPMDILQLASGLIVFTHSINNFKLASKITASATRSTLEELQFQMSKNINQVSTKLSNSTFNRTGSNSIIRPANEIPYKEILVELFANATNQYINRNSTDVSLSNTVTTGTTRAMDLATMTIRFGVSFVNNIMNIESFSDIIDVMRNFFTEDSIQFLLSITTSFINNFSNENVALNAIIPTENILYRIIRFTLNHLDDFSIDNLQSNIDLIIGCLEVLNSYNTRNTEQTCAICCGTFTICDL